MINSQIVEITKKNLHSYIWEEIGTNITAC